MNIDKNNTSPCALKSANTFTYNNDKQLPESPHDIEVIDRYPYPQ